MSSQRAARQLQQFRDALRDMIDAIETARFSEVSKMQEFAQNVAAAMEQSAQVIRDLNKPRPH